MTLSVHDASRRLSLGEVVVIPTDTVYGLAADPHNAEAVAEIFSLKGRSHDQPLLILAADLHQIEPFLISLPRGLYELADTFWPGPLTLILPVDTGRISDTVRAGGATAGFRLPNHPLAIELLKITGPLVVTSANPSGKPPATTPEQVTAHFPELPLLDGGPCQIGIASTILASENGEWKVLREGSLPLSTIEEALH